MLAPFGDPMARGQAEAITAFIKTFPSVMSSLLSFLEKMKSFVATAGFEFVIFLRSVGTRAEPQSRHAHLVLRLFVSLTRQRKSARS